MNGLILLVIGVREEHGGKLVERDLSVRFGIEDGLYLGDAFQGSVVWLAVTQSSKKRQAEEFVRPHVETTEHHTGQGAKSRPQRLDIAHALEVAPDFGAAPRFLVSLELIMSAPLRYCRT